MKTYYIIKDVKTGRTYTRGRWTGAHPTLQMKDSTPFLWSHMEAVNAAVKELRDPGNLALSTKYLQEDERRYRKQEKKLIQAQRDFQVAQDQHMGPRVIKQLASAVETLEEDLKYDRRQLVQHRRGIEEARKLPDLKVEIIPVKIKL